MFEGNILRNTLSQNEVSQIFFGNDYKILDVDNRRKIRAILKYLKKYLLDKYIPLEMTVDSIDIHTDAKSFVENLKASKPDLISKPLDDIISELNVSPVKQSLQSRGVKKQRRPREVNMAEAVPVPVQNKKRRASPDEAGPSGVANMQTDANKRITSVKVSPFNNDIDEAKLMTASQLQSLYNTKSKEIKNWYETSKNRILGKKLKARVVDPIDEISAMFFSNVKTEEFNPKIDTLNLYRAKAIVELNTKIHNMAQKRIKAYEAELAAVERKHENKNTTNEIKQDILELNGILKLFKL